MQQQQQQPKNMCACQPAMIFGCIGQYGPFGTGFSVAWLFQFHLDGQDWDFAH